MSQTPEGKLKAQVKAYLNERGAYWFMPIGVGYGSATVDFLCCIKGRFVAIETKTLPRKPTPRQFHCLNAVREAGGIAFVAYDMDAVRAGLAGL
jgi:hypothetical protein